MQSNSSSLALWSPFLSASYLGRTFSTPIAKTLIWRDVLRYHDDAVPELDWPWLIHRNVPGLPHSISLSHRVFPRLTPNAATSEGRPVVVLDYALAHPDIRVIPQERWLPYGGGSRGVAELMSTGVSPPLFFLKLDGTVGLSLNEALSHDLQNTLVNAQWRPMEGNTSVEVRIGWKGYNPWADQIQLRTRNIIGPPMPITLARLAQHVAAKVAKFIEIHQSAHVPINQAYAEWRVGSGPNDIKPSDIILVGVVSVSKGSIMPILRLG
ncbi:hypothetical protein BV25DRAFT_123565 [Artomyces pyxidatus]|uniref:Uncharacterized protein n=1 Tax=Artomyces pyxidatus TaxID=48021 RepID=A0ACB8TLP1_9AGAM|nr:hypothetical protein BV25DRAFT_123565 [Artomyces pyxidatus]